MQPSRIDDGRFQLRVKSQHSTVSTLNACSNAHIQQTLETLGLAEQCTGRNRTCFQVGHQMVTRRRLLLPMVENGEMHMLDGSNTQLGELHPYAVLAKHKGLRLDENCDITGR